MVAHNNTSAAESQKANSAVEESSEECTLIKIVENITVNKTIKIHVNLSDIRTYTGFVQRAYTANICYLYDVNGVDDLYACYKRSGGYCIC